MAKRRWTLSQVVAGAVPFLLALLLIPVAPRIVRIVEGHTPPPHATTTTTSTLPSRRSTSGGSTKPPLASVTTTTSPPVTTTTTPSVARSVTPTSTTVVSAASSGGDTAPHGTLTETNAQAEVPVDAGTNWTLNASGAVLWTLDCDGTVTQPGPDGIQVPATSSGCSIDLQLDQATAATWELDEY